MLTQPVPSRLQKLGPGLYRDCDRDDVVTVVELMLDENTQAQVDVTARQDGSDEHNVLPGGTGRGGEGGFGGEGPGGAGLG